MNDLVEMLTYRRGAGSVGEKKFIKRYIDSVNGMKKDSFGNRYMRVGRKSADTCFTCHTDTVHNMKSTFTWKGKTYNYDRLLGGRQEVHVKGKWAFKEDGECLGADDGTGVWLCLNLLHARVPGLYIFHRAEEGGGQGSGWIVANKQQLVNNINKMVEFDRKGYTDIITHQGWGRTASDEFAKGLAGQLGGTFRPDDGGVFTDSANYKDLIPECTNVAMGYFNGHTAEEKQDLVFANSLIQRLMKVKWDKLPVERDPKEEQKRTASRNNWWSGGGSYGGYGNYGHYNSWYDDEWGTGQTKKKKSKWGYQNYGFGESYTRKGRDVSQRFPVYCKSCGASWNTNRVPRRCPFCASTQVGKTRPNQTKTKTGPSLLPKNKRYDDVFHYKPEQADIIDTSYIDKLPPKRLKNIPSVSFPGRQVEYIPKHRRSSPDLKYQIRTKYKVFTYRENEVEKGKELDWSYQPQSPKQKQSTSLYDWRKQKDYFDDYNPKYPKKKKKKRSDWDDYWYDPTVF